LLTGPGLIDVSLSLLKNIRSKERYYVQVRDEAGSAGFGAISSVKDPRIVQLALRIEF
jgi:hypothetical protein